MIELITAAPDASAGGATLDAIVLFTVLLLLACHGMARGWPEQLGGADGGGRAAAPRAELKTAGSRLLSNQPKLPNDALIGMGPSNWGVI